MNANFTCIDFNITLIMFYCYRKVWLYCSKIFIWKHVSPT